MRIGDLVCWNKSSRILEAGKYKTYKVIQQTGILLAFKNKTHAIILSSGKILKKKIKDLRVLGFRNS